MKNRALRRGAGVAALYALLAAVLLAGGTFAWFTFRAYTNVTPLAGTIGTGEGDLLISARRDGGFDTQCALPLRDAGAELLIISQFTLFADCKSRRPGFSKAARPEKAIPLYEKVIAECRSRGFKVETGEFGAYMQVDSLNDGPLTIILDTDTL